MRQERVLAYTLATLIDSDDLANVSGGSAAIVIKPSIIVTGGHWRGPDCVYD